MSAVARMACAGLLASVPATPGWADNLSVRVFNVDIFLSGQPDCPTQGERTKLLVSVAPFSDDVGTDEIVSELARRAAEAGKQTVHSIRILSFAPGRGAEIAATAMTCKGPSSPDEAAAVSTTSVSSASGARAYVFPGAGRIGPERSIKSVTTKPVGDLSPQDLEGLKNRIVARLKQPDDGIRSSCPFDPDLGFQMLGAQDLWWLVSTSCRSAMLVGSSADWRRKPTTLLATEDLAAFRRLARL